MFAVLRSLAKAPYHRGRCTTDALTTMTEGSSQLQAWALFGPNFLTIRCPSAIWHAELFLPVTLALQHGHTAALPKLHANPAWQRSGSGRGTYLMSKSSAAAVYHNADLTNFVNTHLARCRFVKDLFHNLNLSIMVASSQCSHLRKILSLFKLTSAHKKHTKNVQREQIQHE